MNRWALLAACLSLGTVACTEDTGTDATPNTPVLLTDSPFPYDEIERVDMYIERIQVTGSPDSSAAYWATVAEPRQTINLLDLQSGTTLLLGTMQLNAYEVSQVRVVINTTLSSLHRADGSVVPVNWGVNGEMTIHAMVEATWADFVPGTQQHRLVIDFDVGRSFVEHGGQLSFVPWIRALDDAGASVVSGTVTADPDGDGQFSPLARAAVTVLHGSARESPASWYKVATGRTDALGRYRVAFILPGEYVVRVEPLGAPAVGCLDSLGIMVGSDITVDLRLAAAPGLCALETGGGGGPDTTGTPVGGPVESVTINPGSIDASVGDSVGVFAHLFNGQGQALYYRTVTWSSNDSTVVVPYGYGQSALLQLKRSGSASIFAASEGKNGAVAVLIR